MDKMRNKTFFSLILVFTLGISIAYAASLQGNPTSNMRETSPFGWRKSTNSNHLAIDLGGTSAGVAGDPVFSTVSGKVVESRYQTNKSHSGGWGNTVLVESDSGNYRVRYSHLDGAGPAIGTTVAPGQTVGAMGGTGKAGGYAVHLDYAVYVKNPDTGKFQAVDPNEAAGKNLDDPNVARALIADANTKVDGKLREEGAPSKDTGRSVDELGGSSAAMIGCDEDVLKSTRAMTDAILDNKAENAKALITQPVPVAQQTCLDQYAKLASANAGTYSNPGGTNPSVASIVEQPLKETWKQFTSGKLAGSVSSVMNESFSDISKTFNSGLSAITGGITTAKSKLSSVFSSGGSPLNVPATNCDAKEQAWLISQCIEMPELPKISNIIGGKIAELQGAVDRFGNLITSPERLLEAVCSKANSKVQSYMGDINSSITGAADKITAPLSDKIDDTTKTINNIPSQIIK